MSRGCAVVGAHSGNGARKFPRAAARLGVHSTSRTLDFVTRRGALGISAQFSPFCLEVGLYNTYKPLWWANTFSEGGEEMLSLKVAHLL